jgi:PKD repeat protein
VSVVSGSLYAFGAWTDAQVPVSGWSWDFGGGCMPNTSDQQYPVGIKALAPGSYDCTVTATNPAGSAVHPFTLVIQ